MTDKIKIDAADTAPALVWNIDIADVPPNGKEFTKIATDDERAALARDLDLLSCDKMTATYRVRRGAGEGYSVRCKLNADVVQACVITLAPVHDTITHDFTVEFHPTTAIDKDTIGAVDLDAETEVEPIDGTTLTIGRVVFEELAAYPRRPGAEYAAPAIADPAADKANPFAVLGTFKAANDPSKS
jgi:uncharacterized metal-binding protein YceD (DUF177 family)